MCISRKSNYHFVNCSRTGGCEITVFTERGCEITVSTEKEDFSDLWPAATAPWENRKTTAKSISDSCISWITILHHTEPLDISSTKYFRIRLKTFLTTSIKQSSTRSMWICNISTSMVPSLKQTPTNIYRSCWREPLSFRYGLFHSFDEALQTNVWYPNCIVRKFP